MAEPVTIAAVLSAAFIGTFAKEITNWLFERFRRSSESKITIHMKDGHEFKISASDLKPEDTAKIIKRLEDFKG